MIEVGDRVFYKNGMIIIVTSDDECDQVNQDWKDGRIKKVERSDFK